MKNLKSNNMKNLALITLLLLSCVRLQAQNYFIGGSVIDQITQKAMEAATVQLLKMDSTLVSTTITGKNGKFNIQTKQAGNYLIKVSFIGYKANIRKTGVTPRNPKIEIGTIIMEENDILLKGAVVKGRGNELTMKKDTFIYNASAFRVPPGATLEELVKKLPGLTLEKDGTIKWNGKQISAIMVNGKKFFAGDTKIALENLPTLIIENIKAYEKESDFTAQTGIEDGEKIPVLDITIKKKYKSSWFGNLNGGLGTNDIFSSRFFLNTFTDRYRISAFGLANNIGENLKPNSDGDWQNENYDYGQNIYRKGGLDFAWDNGKKEREKGRIEVTASLDGEHNNYNYQRTTIEETFLTEQEQSFVYGRAASSSQKTNINLNAQFKWTIDSLTHLTFNQYYNHSNSDRYDYSRSATFNADPVMRGFNYPLDDVFRPAIPDSLRKITVNRSENKNLNYTQSNSITSNLMFLRKLNSKGRSLMLYTALFSSKDKNTSFNLSDIRYYQLDAKEPQRINNQYIPYRGKNRMNYVSARYSEPLAKDVFLSLTYSFDKQYRTGDRPLYQLDSLENWRNTDHPIGTFPSTADSLAMAFNRNNSTFSTYNIYSHTASLDFSLVKKTIRTYAGVRFNPQHTRMDYLRGKLDTTVVRDMSYLSPYASIRYTPTNQSGISAYYNGRKQLPNMTDLLDITDDSNPLYITKGNPGLKSSWSDNLGISGNYANKKNTWSGWSGFNYNRTTNSISRTMHYDPVTGVRTTRPENINGNWRASHYGGANITLDSAKVYRIYGYYNVGYSNSVNFVSVDNIENLKNVSRSWNTNCTLIFNYTKGWTEASLTGFFTYYGIRNSEQPSSNESRFDFSYKGKVQVNLPWNMAVGTDFEVYYRRNYKETTMNGNQYLWNANISQTFLKDKSLIVQLIAKDILNSRTFNYSYIYGNSRYSTDQNGFLSYALLNVIYRFNINPQKK